MKVIVFLAALLCLTLAQNVQKDGWVREWEYDPNGADATGYADWKHDRKHFRWFGALVWTRSFGLGDFITYFPAAITFARANRTRPGALERFTWIAKWWLHIAGWVVTLLNITGGILAISGTLYGRELLGNTDTATWSRLQWTLSGTVLIVFEVIGQFGYYFWRKGAVRYASWQYAEIEQF